ncbi:hypothetical protein JL720_9631 [Aureococcus anophagefferens]|nr:hypothetical protein JL720_9631 [Aureococcus anophagefferens]
MAWLYHKIFDTHKELTRDAALKKLPKVSLEKLVESKSLRAGDVLLVRSDAEVPGSDLHCHPQVSRGVAASCRVPCNKKVTLNGWTEIHVVLGGSAARRAPRHGNLDEAAAGAGAAPVEDEAEPARVVVEPAPGAPRPRDERGELDVDTVVAALKSIPAVHLKSADLRGDVDRFSDEDTLDILQFQSLVDFILDLPPAPHLDRDAYGALSAGFCVGLLRAMAAVALDDDDAARPTPPTTASFGEDDPPLPWRDGFGLAPIRVDVAPAS